MSCFQPVLDDLLIGWEKAKQIGALPFNLLKVPHRDQNAGMPENAGVFLQGVLEDSCPIVVYGVIFTAVHFLVPRSGSRDDQDDKQHNDRKMDGKPYQMRGAPGQGVQSVQNPGDSGHDAHDKHEVGREQKRGLHTVSVLDDERRKRQKAQDDQCGFLGSFEEQACSTDHSQYDVNPSKFGREEPAVDGDQQLRDIAPTGDERSGLVGGQHDVQESLQRRFIFAGDQTTRDRNGPGQSWFRAVCHPQGRTPQWDIQIDQKRGRKEREQNSHPAEVADDGGISEQDIRGEGRPEEHHGAVIGQTEAVHDGKPPQGAFFPVFCPMKQEQKTRAHENQVQRVRFYADRPPPG